MRAKYLITGILILFSMATMAFDHTHSKWNKVLNDHIKTQGHQTLFQYKDLLKDPTLFNQYILEITSVSKDQYDLFTQKQKLAFLINCYNALTVKLIIDNYPVKSIKDLGSFFRSPWTKRFFTFFGEHTHLDNIEHDMIRKWFDEPRIHFAVVCASLGCPTLAKDAFTESNLEDLLEKQSLNFLNDKNENRIENGKLYLSKIFKWYGDDFEKKYGDFRRFIAPRMTNDPNIQKRIINKDMPTRWNDYDWNLNE